MNITSQNNIKLHATSNKIIYLIHKVYTTHKKNNSSFTSSTKTKSEVRGGGKKPWKQKGSGKARAGSNRSPLWKGGGVIFGPKPKKLYKKINKKEKQLALYYLLNIKKHNTTLIPDISELTTQNKTKNLLKLLENLNIKINKNKKIGIITSTFEKNLYLATKNIKNIYIYKFSLLNIENLIKLNTIITDEATLIKINKHYKKNENINAKN